MLVLKKLFVFFSSVFLLFSLTFIAFAAEGDVNVAVTVFNSDGEAFGEVTINIYTLDENTGNYQTSTPGYSTNSPTLVNNISIPIGTTFYAKAYDGLGNVYQYSADPENDNNIWFVLSENVLENVDTGDTRIPYIELYPSGETIAVYTPADPSIEETAPEADPSTEEIDLELDESTESSTDPATMTTVSDPIAYDLFELNVTVHSNKHEPVEAAKVYVYVNDLGLFTYDPDADSVYDSLYISTDVNGQTSGLNIPIDHEFYLFAIDESGNYYGGQYDNYYDRDNDWTSYDGTILENITTGEIKPTELILHPETLVPLDVPEGEEFDPATYFCGDFEDAIYTELTFEECEAIQYVKDSGIFTGTGEGLLEAFRPINRAEVTKVMVEYFGIESIDNLDEVVLFPDVAMGLWYTNYVYTARYKNIVGGYPDGYFRPENKINRVEMLKIFIEASGITAEESYLDIPDETIYYNDVEIEDPPQWFIRYSNYAFLNSLIENDGKLYPTDYMTRMDVIKLLYRASML